MERVWSDWNQLTNMDPKFILYQAILWDKFAKLSPIIITVITSILYCFGFRDWNLVLDTMLILGAIFTICWWFWVIWTIMIIAHILDKSKTNLVDIIRDIQGVKGDIQDLKN